MKWLLQRFATSRMDGKCAISAGEFPMIGGRFKGDIGGLILQLDEEGGFLAPKHHGLGSHSRQTSKMTSDPIQ